MTLLLDARKKLQQTPQPGDTTQADRESLQHDLPGSDAGTTANEPGTPSTEQARNTVHNLFAAKNLLPFVGNTLSRRNLLIVLAGTALLFAAGAAYLWHVGSASNTAPLHNAGVPPAPPTHPIQPAAPDENLSAKVPVAPGIPSETAAEKIQSLASLAEHAPAAGLQPHRSPLAQQNSSPVRIEQRRIEQVDPVLMDAYHAYRNGQLDKAMQLYQSMLSKDAHNTDVLLGLAAIAQQRGERQTAIRYFGRVLTLDPRNAVASAGMAALSPDDDYNESRLKILLREQRNSAILHFALGNLYAGQSRWGEAQQAYFNAYLQEPANAEFAFNLAVSLDHIGQKKPAAQYYQRAIQLDPSHSAGFDHAQILQHARELVR